MAKHVAMETKLVTLVNDPDIYHKQQKQFGRKV